MAESWDQDVANNLSKLDVNETEIKMSLPPLPIEIWTRIFSYLDFGTLQKRATLVCKDWKEMIRGNSNLSGNLVLNLDFEGLQKKATLVSTDWKGITRKKGMIRSYSNFCLYIHHEQWKCQKMISIPCLRNFGQP